MYPKYQTHRLKIVTVIVSRPYLYMEEKSSTQSVHFSCIYLIIENVRMSDGSKFENFHLQIIATLLYDWKRLK